MTLIEEIRERIKCCLTKPDNGMGSYHGLEIMVGMAHQKLKYWKPLTDTIENLPKNAKERKDSSVAEIMAECEELKAVINEANLKVLKKPT